MPTKKSEPKKSVRKTITQSVLAVAKTAKKSAKAVLKTKSPAPVPVEIEPRPLESPQLRTLLRERARLAQELKKQELQAQDHPTTGNHMADDATEVEEQTKSLALRQHVEGMLKEIDRAIARAEKGTYGICERCKKPIAEERLKVMPSATLCIECAKLQTNHHPVKAVA